jgi:tetratricopeptide (TPR) repeat protein
MPNFKNSLEALNNIKSKGFNAESEMIDYKRCFNFEAKREKLELVKDIVAFANTSGGYIVFGVTDKDCEWIGLDENSTIKFADDSIISSFIDHYVDKSPSFQIGRYTIDGEVFLLLTIDKIDGNPIVFTKEGEYERIKLSSNKPSKEHVFKKGDIYGRVKSSSRRVNDDASFMSLRNSNTSIVSNLNLYARPYRRYVDRNDSLDELIAALDNDRIRSAQINGLGGIGKTSFVRNFCDRIINKEIELKTPVKYIIWITGKLDSFTSTGYIETIREYELSFVEMLQIFSSVLSIDTFDKTEEELCKDILEKLSNYNALIVMDNMETISDERIIKFVRSIPLNCMIVYTTRTNMTDSFRRIDLVGFNKKQFYEYVDNCLDEFAPKRKEALKQFLSNYYDDLVILVQGSPILINLIIYMISIGGSVEVIVDNLRNMKKNESYYDSVMEFCFKSTFDKLNILEKKILFAMSISDINDEAFSIADLSYIVKSDKSDVNIAIMNLFSYSFCIQRDQAYICQPLVKIFANKQLSDETKLKGRESISNRYYEWSKTKTQIDTYETSLFNKAKAFTFERKKAFLKTREIRKQYEIGLDYESIIIEINKLISEVPDYAYLYLFRAEIVKKEDDTLRQIYLDYEQAISLDKENDYYIAEYAYFLSYKKKNAEAIPYFQKALSIKDFQNYHFGLAVAYVKSYNNKPEFYDKSEEILSHFQKAYFDLSDKKNLFRNGRTADAHARYLRELGRINEALEVCERGLEHSPSDEKLKVLKGQLMKRMDPNFISERQKRNIRKGLFAGVDDETAKKLAEIYDEE